MYEKYGISEADFLAIGEDWYTKDGFWNTPYYQRIVVATTQLEWDAISYFLGKKHDLVTGIAPFAKTYETSAGFTLRFYDGQNVISMIGLHTHSLRDFYHSDFTQFINTLSHEVQHLLIGYEEQFKVSSIEEEEPHAYMTGTVTSNIIEILRRKWDKAFVAIPNAVYGCIDGLGKLPGFVKPSVLSVLSGVTQQYMVSNQSEVRYAGVDWSATTYWSGGSHVDS